MNMMTSPVKIWRNQKKVQKMLGKEGVIVSYSTVFVPPAGFEAQAPYVVILVKMSHGGSYTAQLVDYEETQVRIGQKVKAVLRRTRDPHDEGIIPYGIKFKPI